MTVNLNLPANWKSTLSGAVASFFAFVLFSPAYFPPWLVDLARFAAPGGILSLAWHAKDKDVHSTLAQMVTATVKAEEPIPPAAVPLVGQVVMATAVSKEAEKPK